MTRNTGGTAALLWRKRKGDGELTLLAVMLFFGVMAQVAFMFAAPDTYKGMLQRQINDAEPLGKASTMKTHLEEEYVPNALTDAAYQGMYVRGKNGFGPWDAPPPWEEIKPLFDDSVTTVLKQDYIGAVRSGTRCSVHGGGQVGMAHDVEEWQSDGASADVTTFAVSNDNPLYVQCEAARLIGQPLSTRVKELIAVPAERQVPRMRYQEMHSVARDMIADDTFQNLVETARHSATRAVITSCEKTIDGNDESCGPWDPPSTLNEVPDDLANEQEEAAGERLETRLQDTFGDAYTDRAFDVTVTVREVEFDPQNERQISASTGSWRTGCSKSSPPATWTVRSRTCTCDDCVGDRTCSNDPKPEVCGARCTDSQWCPTVADQPGSSPPEPASTGSYWTEDVWSADCNILRNGHDDPYDYSQTSTVAHHESTMRPLRTLTHGTHMEEGPVAGPDGGGDGGGSDPTTICSYSCSERERSCDKYLTHGSRTQTALSFDLESYTVVEVTMTDTRNEIPTDQGFASPEYTFTYEKMYTQSRR